MDIVPEEYYSVIEYLKECFDDLNKYTSNVSQEVIKNRIQKASIKLSTFNNL